MWFTCDLCVGCGLAGWHSQTRQLYLLGPKRRRNKGQYHPRTAHSPRPKDNPWGIRGKRSAATGATTCQRNCFALNPAAISFPSSASSNPQVPMANGKWQTCKPCLRQRPRPPGQTSFYIQDPIYFLIDICVTVSTGDWLKGCAPRIVPSTAKVNLQLLDGGYGIRIGIGIRSRDRDRG